MSRSTRRILRLRVVPFGTVARNQGAQTFASLNSWFESNKEERKVQGLLAHGSAEVLVLDGQVQQRAVTLNPKILTLKI